MSKIVLAADLGGTNLRIATVSEDGTRIHRARASTPVSRSRQEIIDSIVLLAEECRRTSGTDEIVAFGVAAPAIISSDDRTIFSSPNLPDLNGLDLSSVLSERLGIPVLLENDANAAALGENWLGASRSTKNSICVTLGTGVGGGLILDGCLVRGVDGTAGEVGHTMVEPDGHPCGCGSVGCLEQYSSATAIVRLANQLTPMYPESPIAKLSVISATDVYDAGMKNDELSREVFRAFGTYLGMALAGLINVLNPEVIVLGGGVSAGWDCFIDHVREQIRMRAFREPGERVKLIRAELGDDAGILGSAKLAFEMVKGL
ncbi:MAG: ROK family protein [Pyrinomonadaceae bacterium]